MDIKDLILKEFTFIDHKKFIESPYFSKLNNSNSVSICLRQNRFNEGKNHVDNVINSKKSTQEFYKVKKGDTLYSIARKFNTTVAIIKKVNALTTNSLSIGQQLVVN